MKYAELRIVLRISNLNGNYNENCFFIYVGTTHIKTYSDYVHIFDEKLNYRDVIFKFLVTITQSS